MNEEIRVSSAGMAGSLTSPGEAFPLQGLEPADAEEGNPVPTAYPGAATPSAEPPAPPAAAGSAGHTWARPRGRLDSRLCPPGKPPGGWHSASP